MKSGSLNLLEPNGPVQAFTGIALPRFNLLPNAGTPEAFHSAHSVWVCDWSAAYYEQRLLTRSSINCMVFVTETQGV
jgi:hypothetical protein